MNLISGDTNVESITPYRIGCLVNMQEHKDIIKRGAIPLYKSIDLDGEQSVSYTRRDEIVATKIFPLLPDYGFEQTEHEGRIYLTAYVHCRLRGDEYYEWCYKVTGRMRDPRQSDDTPRTKVMEASLDVIAKWLVCN